MMRRLVKITSLMLMLIIIVQICGASMYIASEIKEESKTSSEDVLEATSEEVSEIKSESIYLEEGATRDYTDASGIGNQNTSSIGKGTYLYPNEDTENELKTIKDLNSEDATKYTAVTDLDRELIDVAIQDKNVGEGIMLKEYPESWSSSQIDADIASHLSFSGTCWQDETANKKNNTTNY